jgi:hypothetical protein
MDDIPVHGSFPVFETPSKITLSGDTTSTWLASFANAKTIVPVKPFNMAGRTAAKFQVHMKEVKVSIPFTATVQFNLPEVTETVSGVYEGTDYLPVEYIMTV